MKYSTKIINTGSKTVYNQLNIKEGGSHEEYKKVIKAISVLRCQDVLESEEGHLLPSGVGKLIILGNKPRVKQVYSMTRPGKKIFNLHTFGLVYRIYHKEYSALRYPVLFRWRSHRANLKVPLHHILVNQLKNYYPLRSFKE